MNSKQLSMLILLMLGFSLFSHVSIAGPEKGHFKKMMKELNLTQDQKDKMKELRKNKPDMKASRKEMRELREKFKNAMKSDASEVELRKLHGQLQDKKTTMAKNRFDQMLKIRSLLTPEQRQKFQEMRQRGGRNRGGKNR